LRRVDGPREDVAVVTSFTYAPDSGNLLTVTNAAGHVTRVTAHDAHGRPVAITEADGLVVGLAYDARGRLQRRTAAGLTTRFDYDAAGQLVRLVLPDDSYIAYEYDAAHRLIGITDGVGNRL